MTAPVSPAAAPVAEPNAKLKSAEPFTWAAAVAGFLCCGCWPLTGALTVIAIVSFNKAGGSIWPMPDKATESEYYWSWIRIAIGAVMTVAWAFAMILYGLGNWVSS